jgi:integrase/recombinase XerD
MTTSRSPLRDALGDYLSLRRALGFQLASAGRLLGQFVGYLEAHGMDAVTAEHALAWATQPAGASVHWQAIRLSVVRGFAAYLHSIDSTAEVIPAGQFRPGVCRATPYLYSDAEIRALIGAAATLQPQLRAATYQTLISLLAISGIRIGEAIGLDDEDFDTGRGLLVVRHAKYASTAWCRCTPAPCAPWRGMPSSGGTRSRGRPAPPCSCPPPGPGCGTVTSG